MFENAKDLIDQLDESHLEAATHNNKFYVQKETKYELLPETQRKFVPYNGTRDPGRIAWEREKILENTVQLKIKY